MTQNPHTPPKDQQNDELPRSVCCNATAWIGLQAPVSYECDNCHEECQMRQPQPTPTNDSDEQLREQLIEEIGSLTVGEEPHQIRNFLGFAALGVVADWHMQLIAQARKGNERESKLDKARYSNIESIIHGGLVEWGWDIATANEAQARITKDVLAYMAQHTVPKSDVAAKVAKAKKHLAGT